MDTTIFPFDFPCCATCALWGGPRKPNNAAEYVEVDSQAEGHCGGWYNETQAGLGCNLHEPLK